MFLWKKDTWQMGINNFQFFLGNAYIIKYLFDFLWLFCIVQALVMLL
jgi:hypothetical protein